MTRIKICGLTRLEDIDYVNIYKPDYVGVVFADSRRQVNKETARKLKSRLDPSITTVGVFVNAPTETIVDLLEEGIIDMPQLHGRETEEDILAILRRVKVPVIKAVSVSGINDVLAWQHSAADYLLLDSGKGGTGQPFDWSMIAALNNMGFSKPYFLAGGLKTENVKEALLYAPYGVDASSGLETNGFKDVKKIEQFVNLVRNDERKREEM